MYDKSEGGGWWGSKAERLGMGVYLGGGPDGGFRKSQLVKDMTEPPCRRRRIMDSATVGAVSTNDI